MATHSPAWSWICLSQLRPAAVSWEVSGPLAPPAVQRGFPQQIFLCQPPFPIWVSPVMELGSKPTLGSRVFTEMRSVSKLAGVSESWPVRFPWEHLTKHRF